MITAQGKYSPLHEMTPGRRSIRSSRATRATSPIGWHAIVEDPMQFDQLTATLQLFAGRRPARAPSAGTPTSTSTPSPGTSSTGTTRPASTTCSARPSKSRKGDAVIVGYKKPLIYDPPRELDFTAEVAGYYRPRHPARARRTRGRRRRPNIASLRRALKYTDVTQSLGAVDHERGVVWNLAFDGDYLRRRRLSAHARRASASASRSAGPTPRSGSTTPPASPGATAPTRSAPTTSARSATTMSMTAR